MSAMAHAELQVKEVLSPRGFMYMVTVMDNKPEDILQLLSDESIEGRHLLLLGIYHSTSSCLLATFTAIVLYVISSTSTIPLRRVDKPEGSGKKMAANANGLMQAR